jgi:carboxyl-terminal processing protease
MKPIYFFCVFILLSLQKCGNDLLENNYQNTIAGNFDALWNEFDLEYGAFNAKRINWDSLKIIYRNKLSGESSEHELYDALCGLLSELNDGHVDLEAPQFGLFSSWNRRNKSYYRDVYSHYFIYDQWAVAVKNHFQKGFKSDTVSGCVHFYGIIDYQGKKFGYINISTFYSSGYSSAFVQNAVDTFNQLDGVLIDLRFNLGGDAETSVNCLNSFAGKREKFMISKFRNGPSHNDFTKSFESWIDPHTDCLKNKPVALLMNNMTCSASELFILGMKTQSNVITVGDTSHGAFSSVRKRILPNGWGYRICSEVVYNPDGSLLVDSKGNYLEGIGIAPDYYVPDYYNKLINGIDLPLDTAIHKLFIKGTSKNSSKGNGSLFLRPAPVGQ